MVVFLFDVWIHILAYRKSHAKISFGPTTHTVLDYSKPSIVLSLPKPPNRPEFEKFLVYKDYIYALFHQPITSLPDLKVGYLR